MEKNDLDKLFRQDWVEIHARVLKYARWILARNGLTLTAMLGKGHTAEDLVDQAIAELLDNPEKVNWEIGPERQIRRMIRPRIGNCLNYKDNRTREHSEEPVKNAIAIQPPPEDSVEVSEEVDRIFDLYLQHPRVKNKPDYELVVYALLDGVRDPEAIAEETGLNRKRVYDIRQVLLEIYPLIRKQMALAGEQA